MVMTTDFPSGGKMEQTQVKSDVPFAGNKAPTTSASPLSERQFTRVLRSKSSTSVKSSSSSCDTEKGEVHSSARVPFLKLSEPEITQDSFNHKTDASQVTHLRQLLLLHLELIQQQQEELQRKDREINQLKLDKEQLESRMHRLERRMAVKKRRDVNEGYDEILEEKDLKQATPKSRRLSVEQMVRAKRVPATASVTMTSQMCEDISYDTHMRTEMLYLHGDARDFSKKTINPVGNKDQEHVQVPTWQINEIAAATVRQSSSKSLKTSGAVSCLESVEITDDEAFAKRHMKQELEEKRRKRWDLQHMRAMQAYQSLEKKSRDREEARLKGKKVGSKDDAAKCMESFLPPPEDVMAVEVSDTVPVVAFGYPVPLFHNREFEVPWFSLDKRELIERKGKVKPGRTRGKPRGRRKGYS